MPREKHSSRYYDLLNKEILIQNKLDKERDKMIDMATKMPDRSESAFYAFIYGEDMSKFPNLPAYELEWFERKAGWFRRNVIALQRIQQQLTANK